MACIQEQLMMVGVRYIIPTYCPTKLFHFSRHGSYFQTAYVYLILTWWQIICWNVLNFEYQIFVTVFFRHAQLKKPIQILDIQQVKINELPRTLMRDQFSSSMIGPKHQRKSIRRNYKILIIYNSFNQSQDNQPDEILML